jgi:NMD protein affecting ribosome stability and mRNA decay
LRLHTFGIGSGVSTDLVKRSAEAGNGMYYFVDDVKEVEKKVIDALCQSALPYLKINKIEFYDASNNQIKVENFKVNDFDALVNGKSFQKFIFIENEKKATKVKFSIYDPNSKETETFYVDLK